MDARSVLLLESNFISLLAVFKLELCHDFTVEKVSAEILGVYEAYHSLSCKCLSCLANLRVSIYIYILMLSLFEVCLTNLRSQNLVKDSPVGQRDSCSVRTVRGQAQDDASGSKSNEKRHREQDFHSIDNITCNI
jgi:hypothetical protein